MRSLAASNPILTAKESLMSLFEEAKRKVSHQNAVFLRKQSSAFFKSAIWSLISTVETEHVHDDHNLYFNRLNSLSEEGGRSMKEVPRVQQWKGDESGMMAPVLRFGSALVAKQEPHHLREAAASPAETPNRMESLAVLVPLR